MNVYAEIVLAGGDPDHLLPGIAAHLKACDPCDEDYRGLLNALISASDGRSER